MPMVSLLQKIHMEKSDVLSVVFFSICLVSCYSWFVNSVHVWVNSSHRLRACTTLSAWNGSPSVWMWCMRLHLDQ
jgi:hypothetical protein